MALQNFKVPVVNIPQTFEIALGGVSYILTCKWNPANEGGWILDFADAQTNEPIVTNVPLITGANILENLDYLGFTGALYIFTDGNDLAVPTLENLGVESNLYFQTEVT